MPKARSLVTMLALYVLAAACGSKKEGANPAGDYAFTSAILANGCAACGIPSNSTLSINEEAAGYTLGSYWSTLQDRENNFSAVHLLPTSAVCSPDTCCNKLIQDTIAFAIEVDKLTGTWMQIQGSADTNGALCTSEPLCVCTANITGYR